MLLQSGDVISSRIESSTMPNADYRSLLLPRMPSVAAMNKRKDGQILTEEHMHQVCLQADGLGRPSASWIHMDSHRL